MLNNFDLIFENPKHIKNLKDLELIIKRIAVKKIEVEFKETKQTKEKYFSAKTIIF